MNRQILPVHCWTGGAGHRNFSDRNIDMHPDRKIGFAMGILLIGVVAALFFRNEPLLTNDVPAVRREKELNEQLRVRDVAVYLDDSATEVLTISPAAPESPQWTLKELLKDLNEKNDGVPLPVGVVVNAEPAKNEPQTRFFDDEKDTFVKPPPLVGDLPAIIGDNAQDAAQSLINADEYEEYVVRYGDTLSHIAERFLGSQTRFQEIYDANRDRIPAPDRLQVGRAIRIPRQ